MNATAAATTTDNDAKYQRLVQQRKEASKRYRLKNLEKFRQYSKKYYDNNKEQILEYKKEYYEKTKQDKKESGEEQDGVDLS